MECMLSLIVCSTRSSLLHRLKQNVASTIGEIKYEWVVIDNSKGSHSIFEAYNEGVRKSVGDWLCFVHEDVEFQQIKWGGGLSKWLKVDNLGCVGFGGAHMLPDAPMYWSMTPYISEYCQHNDHGRVYDCIHTDYFKEDMIDVSAVDGFCMFMPRDVFKFVCWDEKYYSGFHAYDMDICMQLLQAGYRVCVNRELLVMHYWAESEMLKKQGSESFYENMRKFYEKWHKSLPIVRGIELNKQQIDLTNSLSQMAVESYMIRESLAYRLGKAILHPSKENIKRLFKL